MNKISVLYTKTFLHSANIHDIMSEISAVFCAFTVLKNVLVQILINRRVTDIFFDTVSAFQMLWFLSVFLLLHLVCVYPCITMQVSSEFPLVMTSSLLKFIRWFFRQQSVLKMLYDSLYIVVLTQRSCRAQCQQYQGHVFNSQGTQTDKT